MLTLCCAPEAADLGGAPFGMAAPVLLLSRPSTGSRRGACCHHPPTLLLATTPASAQHPQPESWFLST